jgi:uncharacterized membrane protein required for colicin V production
MFVDAIAVAILIVFVAIGALQGSITSALRLLTLIGSYVAALTLAPAAADVVGEIASVPGFLRVPAAGGVLFLTAFVVLGILSKIVSGMERRWRGDYPRTWWDRTGGGSIGLMRGALIVLLIGVLGQWTEALRVAGQLEGVPDGGPSAVVEVTKTVVETGTRAALGDENVAARVAVRLFSEPAEVVGSLQTLTDNARILGLQSDALFWTYVSNGAYDAALNQGSFLGITYDETLRGELASLGLIEREAAEDPRLFRQAMKEVLQDIGPRLRNLQHDPALRALAEDPEVRAALEQGNTLTLLRNEDFQGLVARVMSGGPGE